MSAADLARDAARQAAASGAPLPGTTSFADAEVLVAEAPAPEDAAAEPGPVATEAAIAEGESDAEPDGKQPDVGEARVADALAEAPVEEAAPGASPATAGETPAPAAETVETSGPPLDADAGAEASAPAPPPAPATSAPADGPLADVRADSGTPPPDPTPSSDASEEVVAAPTEDQPAGAMAPTVERGVLLVHAAPRVSPEELERTVAALSAAGYALEQPVRVDFRISQTNVRYFHSEDAELAGDVASAVTGVARDFTNYRPAPPPGTIEVWLEG